MKNLSKIPLKIVQQTIFRLNYLKYMGILVKYDYREWCSKNYENWQYTSTVDKFVKWIEKENRLGEFYKDIMNEISTEVNPANDD